MEAFGRRKGVVEKLLKYKPTENPLPIIPIKATEETVEIEKPTVKDLSLPSISNWADKLKTYRSEFLNSVTNKDTDSDTSQDTSVSTPSILSGKITGPEEFERVWDEYIKENPEATEWRDFFTKLAKRESSFRNIQNTAGAPAYGFFQLLDTNLQGYTPEQVLADPKLQIKLAIDLDKKNLRNFTQEDFDTAQKLGFTKNAMRWGAWLGGIGGVRNYLYKNKDATDSHYYGGKGGSSVGKYMRIGNYKDGGSLKDVNIAKVGNEEYYIEIVESDKDKTIGLSDRDNLPKDEGMLFVINDDEKDKNGLIWFTMEDTKFPLDIIFISEDLEVTQVSEGKPMSTEPIYGKGDYVLEINAHSDVKVGDDLEFISEKEVNKKMMVLDSEGNPQMMLDGGERIMSINNTKTLIKFAKKASATNNDNDYKTLGKRVFKFLEVQDSATPEYV